MFSLVNFHYVQYTELKLSNVHSHLLESPPFYTLFTSNIK